MQPIKISIITVSFNSEKTIRETIESVLGQNYPNLEYIIIDGKSTDRTLEIIHEYGDRISKVVSEPDKGVADAFNKGIALCTGVLIGIINSDDLLEKDALKILNESYTADVDVYRGNCVIWNDQTGLKRIGVPTMNLNVNHFRINIVHPSTFISKSAYQKYGVYNIKYKYAMDTDILLRLHRLKATFVYIPKALAIFRLGGVTDRTVEWEKWPEQIAIRKENGGNILCIYCYIVYRFFVNIGKIILFKISPDAHIKLGYLKSN